jgi:beta-mannanase
MPNIRAVHGLRVVAVAAALAALAAATVLRAPDHPAASTSRTTSPAIVHQASTTCGSAGKYAPKCGALWGIYSLQNGDPQKSVRTLESQVGRKFDLVLNYHDFSSSLVQGTIPDKYETALGADHMLFADWQARVSSTNKNLSWKSIANGTYDKYVVANAARVKAYGKPMIIAFDPEFDTLPSKGTPADYVAAYRHVFNVFKSKGVTNVAWAWVTSGYTGAGNGTKILQGYPGDAYVDWIGWDPYNFYKCNGTSWQTFAQKVTPTYDWLKAHGHGNKPFLLSEYGTQYDTANAARSKAWHAAIPAALKQLPNLKALVRFDAQGYFRSKKCDFFIKNGPGSLDSFAQAGKAVQASLSK